MNALLNFFDRHRAGSLCIILALTMLAYSNIFTNQFVWDDPDFYKNWALLYRFDSIGTLLQGTLPVQHAGVYRPLRSAVQLVLFQLFGGTNLIGYHTVSLLIHLSSVVAVYLIIGQLTKRRVAAAVGALIFGLHPIHIEAISYITTSIDVIGVMLLLWSVYAYLRWRDPPASPTKRGEPANRRWQWLSILLGWLAFFTYEMTIVLPLLLLLIEWQRSEWSVSAAVKKIKVHWPYWLGVITILTARSLMGVGQRALTPDPSQSSLPIRLMTMGKSIVKYLYLLFAPFDLNVFHKINLTTTLAEPKALAAWLAVIGLFILTMVFIKKLRLVGFGLLWFFIAVMPVSNVIPTGIIMAEKYMYLASFGICLIWGIFIAFLLTSSKKLLPLLGVIVLVAAAGSYGAKTYARNFDWQSNQTLWQATLDKRPDYGRVYSNLGFSYYYQKDYQRALELFEKAKELEPKLPLIYHNLGNVYDELGQYDLAIENFQKALELRDFGEYYNYAETYNNMAIVYQEQNDLTRAVENFQKAIEIDPTYFRAYSNWGVINLLTEDYEQAKTNFERAIEINPRMAAAHHGLAAALVNLGDPDAALSHYQRSMALDATLVDNYNHLASIYVQQNKAAEAIDILRRGVASNPEDVGLATNLAIVLANSGQLDAAREAVKRALELDPNFQAAQQLSQQLGQ